MYFLPRTGLRDLGSVDKRKRSNICVEPLPLREADYKYDEKYPPPLNVQIETNWIYILAMLRLYSVGGVFY